MKTIGRMFGFGSANAADNNADHTQDLLELLGKWANTNFLVDTPGEANRNFKSWKCEVDGAGYKIYAVGNNQRSEGFRVKDVGGIEVYNNSAKKWKAISENSRDVKKILFEAIKAAASSKFPVVRAPAPVQASVQAPAPAQPQAQRSGAQASSVNEANHPYRYKFTHGSDDYECREEVNAGVTTQTFSKITKDPKEGEKAKVVFKTEERSGTTTGKTYFVPQAASNKRGLIYTEGEEWSKQIAEGSKKEGFKSIFNAYASQAITEVTKPEADFVDILRNMPIGMEVRNGQDAFIKAIGDGNAIDLYYYKYDQQDKIDGEVKEIKDATSKYKEVVSGTEIVNALAAILPKYYANDQDDASQSTVSVPETKDIKALSAEFEVKLLNNVLSPQNSVTQKTRSSLGYDVYSLGEDADQKRYYLSKGSPTATAGVMWGMSGTDKVGKEMTALEIVEATIALRDKVRGKLQADAAAKDFFSGSLVKDVNAAIDHNNNSNAVGNLIEAVKQAIDVDNDAAKTDSAQAIVELFLSFNSKDDADSFFEIYDEKGEEKDTVALLQKFAQTNIAAFANSTNPNLNNLAGIFYELGIHENDADDRNSDDDTSEEFALSSYQQAANAGNESAFESVIRFYEGEIGIADADKEEYKERAKILTALGEKIDFRSKSKLSFDVSDSAENLQAKLTDIEHRNNVAEAKRGTYFLSNTVPVVVPQILEEKVLDSAAARNLIFENARKKFKCSNKGGGGYLIKPTEDTQNYYYSVTFDVDGKATAEKYSTSNSKLSATLKDSQEFAILVRNLKEEIKKEYQKQNLQQGQSPQPQQQEELSLVIGSGDSFGAGSDVSPSAPDESSKPKSAKDRDFKVDPIRADEDFFDISGAEVGETKKEILQNVNKAYKKLALKNHTDKGGDKEVFQGIGKLFEECKEYLEAFQDDHVVTLPNPSKVLLQEAVDSNLSFVNEALGVKFKCRAGDKQGEYHIINDDGSDQNIIYTVSCPNRIKMTVLNNKNTKVDNDHFQREIISAINAKKTLSAEDIGPVNDIKKSLSKVGESRDFKYDGKVFKCTNDADELIFSVKEKGVFVEKFKIPKSFENDSKVLVKGIDGWIESKSAKDIRFFSALVQRAIEFDNFYQISAVNVQEKIAEDKDLLAVALRECGASFARGSQFLAKANIDDGLKFNESKNPHLRNLAGAFYETGTGVAADLAKALACYEEAAKLGSKDALKNMIRCYENGSGVPDAEKSKYRDTVKTLEDLKWAAENNTGTLNIDGEKYQVAAHDAGFLFVVSKSGVESLEVRLDKGSFVIKDENDKKVQLLTKIQKQISYKKTFDLPDLISRYGIEFKEGSGAYRCFAGAKGADGNVTEYNVYQVNEHGDKIETASHYRLTKSEDVSGFKVEKITPSVVLGRVMSYTTTTDSGTPWIKGQMLVAKGKLEAEDFYRDGVTVDESKPEEAFKLYKAAAAEGYIPARYELGRCYENGIGVERNPAKAVECYQIAADCEDPRAQVSLGLCYENGIGVKKDVNNAVKAFKLYEKAADQEYAEGQYQFGRCNEETNSLGVAFDNNIALEKYNLASNQNHAKAKIVLGRFSENGLKYNSADLVVEDKLKALEFYRAAAKLGDGEAVDHVIRCYREGVGVAQSKETADVLEKLKWAAGKQEDFEVVINDPKNPSQEIKYQFQYHPAEGFKITESGKDPEVGFSITAIFSEDFGIKIGGEVDAEEDYGQEIIDSNNSTIKAIADAIGILQDKEKKPLKSLSAECFEFIKNDHEARQHKIKMPVGYDERVYEIEGKYYAINRSKGLYVSDDGKEFKELTHGEVSVKISKLRKSQLDRGVGIIDREVKRDLINKVKTALGADAHEATAIRAVNDFLGFGKITSVAGATTVVFEGATPDSVQAALNNAGAGADKLKDFAATKYDVFSAMDATDGAKVANPHLANLAGVFYETGLSKRVTQIKMPASALKLYELAAKGGSEAALDNVIRCYKDKNAIGANLNQYKKRAEVLEALKLAAEKGEEIEVLNGAIATKYKVEKYAAGDKGFVIKADANEVLKVLVDKVCDGGGNEINDGFKDDKTLQSIVAEIKQSMAYESSIAAREKANVKVPHQLLLGNDGFKDTLKKFAAQELEIEVAGTSSTSLSSGAAASKKFRFEIVKDETDTEVGCKFEVIQDRIQPWAVPGDHYLVTFEDAVQGPKVEKFHRGNLGSSKVKAEEEDNKQFAGLVNSICNKVTFTEVESGKIITKLEGVKDGYDLEFKHGGVDYKCSSITNTTLNPFDDEEWLLEGTSNNPFDDKFKLVKVSDSEIKLRVQDDADWKDCTPEEFLNFAAFIPSIQTKREKFAAILDKMSSDVEVAITTDDASSGTSTTTYFVKEVKDGEATLHQFKRDENGLFQDPKEVKKDAADIAEFDVAINLLSEHYLVATSLAPTNTKFEKSLKDISADCFELIKNDHDAVESPLNHSVPAYEKGGERYFIRLADGVLCKLNKAGKDTELSAWEIVQKADELEKAQRERGADALLNNQKDELIAAVAAEIAAATQTPTPTPTQRATAIRAVNDFLGFGKITSAASATTVVFEGATLASVQSALGKAGAGADKLKDFAKANVGNFSESETIIGASVATIKNAHLRNLAGVFYELGIHDASNNKDPKEALKLYELAAKGGSEAALDNVIRCYKGGIGIDVAAATAANTSAAAPVSSTAATATPTPALTKEDYAERAKVLEALKWAAEKDAVGKDRKIFTSSSATTVAKYESGKGFEIKFSPSDLTTVDIDSVKDPRIQALVKAINSQKTVESTSTAKKLAAGAVAAVPTLVGASIGAGVGVVGTAGALGVGAIAGAAYGTYKAGEFVEEKTKLFSESAKFMGLVPRKGVDSAGVKLDSLEEAAKNGRIVTIVSNYKKSEGYEKYGISRYPKSGDVGHFEICPLDENGAKKPNGRRYDVIFENGAITKINVFDGVSAVDATDKERLQEIATKFNILKIAKKGFEGDDEVGYLKERLNGVFAEPDQANDAIKRICFEGKVGGERGKYECSLEAPAVAASGSAPAEDWVFRKITIDADGREAVENFVKIVLDTSADPKTATVKLWEESPFGWKDCADPKQFQEIVSLIDGIKGQMKMTQEQVLVKDDMRLIRDGKGTDRGLIALVKEELDKALTTTTSSPSSVTTSTTATAIKITAAEIVDDFLGISNRESEKDPLWKGTDVPKGVKDLLTNFAIDQITASTDASSGSAAVDGVKAAAKTTTTATATATQSLSLQKYLVARFCEDNIEIDQIDSYVVTDDSRKTKAVELYKAAADAGNQYAQNSYGRLLETGVKNAANNADILAKNLGDALTQYDAAAQQGNAAAIVNANHFRAEIKKISASNSASTTTTAPSNKEEEVKAALVKSLKHAIFDADAAKKAEKEKKISEVFFGDKEEKVNGKVIGRYSSQSKIEQLASLSLDEKDGVKQFATDQVSELVKSDDLDLKVLAGQIYFEGIGVEKDLAQAKKCFEGAAGVSVKGGDLVWDVQGGYAPAQHNLGLLYLSGGDGLPKDEKKAFECFEKASQQGFQPAISALGACYQKGAGVEKSLEKAQEELKKIEKIFDASSASVPSTAPTSTTVSTTATTSAVTDAYLNGLYNLALVKDEIARQKGNNLEDKKDAFDTLKKAVDSGSGLGHFDLGRYYEAGIDSVTVSATSSGAAGIASVAVTAPAITSIKANDREAQRQYVKGTEKGDPNCMRANARMLEEGRFADRNGSLIRGEEFAQILKDRADLFEQCSVSLKHGKGIVVPNSDSWIGSTTTYKVSRCVDQDKGGFILSVDGKEREGFKILSDGFFYKISGGISRIQVDEWSENAQLSQIVGKMQEDNKSQALDIDAKVINDLVGKVFGVIKGDISQAQVVVENFLGIRNKMSDGQINIGSNAPSTVFYSENQKNDEFSLTPYVHVPNSRKAVLTLFTKFMKRHLKEFEDSSNPHLNTLAGNYYRGISEDVSAKLCYEKAAKQDFLPAKHGLVEMEIDNLANAAAATATSTTASTSPPPSTPIEEKYKDLLLAGYPPSVKAVSKKKWEDTAATPQQKTHADALIKLPFEGAEVKIDREFSPGKYESVTYCISPYDVHRGISINVKGRSGEGFRVDSILDTSPSTSSTPASRGVYAIKGGKEELIKTQMHPDLQKVLDRCERIQQNKPSPATTAPQGNSLMNRIRGR